MLPKGWGPQLPLATKKQEPWKSLLPYIYPLGDGQHPGDLLLQRIDKERNVLTYIDSWCIIKSKKVGGAIMREGYSDSGAGQLVNGLVDRSLIRNIGSGQTKVMMVGVIRKRDGRIIGGKVKTVLLGQVVEMHRKP